MLNNTAEAAEFRLAGFLLSRAGPAAANVCGVASLPRTKPGLPVNKNPRSFASISPTGTAWFAPGGTMRFRVARLSELWSRTLAVMWSDVEFRYLTSSLGRLLEQVGTYTRPASFAPFGGRFAESTDVTPTAIDVAAVTAAEPAAIQAAESAAGIMTMPVVVAVQAADSAAAAETRAHIFSEFVVVREDLTLLRELMKDAVDQMGDEFHALINRVKEQDLLIQSMSAKACGSANSTKGLRAVATETGEVLAQLGQRIERTNLNSATMARQIDAVDFRIDEVTTLVSGVKQLASSTRLLALNALIEAAHAGDAGLGFGSVAHEVKSLSQNSDALSDDIFQAAAEARKIMTTARGTMTGLVDHDTKFTLEARDRVKAALEEVGNVNSALADDLNSAARVSREILDNASLAETALQFDDMVNQVIEQIESRLQRLEPSVRESSQAA